jgi:RNA-directed DNA polymerase
MDEECAAALRLRREQNLSVAELARRLGMIEDELRQIEPCYQEFTLAKRSGGTRRILAPTPPLKAVQRRILRRLLSQLRCHPAAHGFERRRSIVTHALPHTGQAVVLCLDIKNFFESTSVKRVHTFFRDLGWSKEAADLLRRLCTTDGGLPQGAPTSPRLSNLVNMRLDARLTGLVARSAVQFRNPRTGSRVLQTASHTQLAVYTRYADDLTFSFPSADSAWISYVLWFAKRIITAEGYELHRRKKRRIRRRHQQQRVTGLVVNERVNLPRDLRRRLRAMEHQLRIGRATTLPPDEIAGWRALQAMIDRQRGT